MFDGDGDRLARTREGGHSAFRVIHAGGDATGAEIERALVRAAAGLPLLTGHVAVDVLRDARGHVVGLSVLDDAGRPGVLRAPAVVLATGGYGQLYASTTNPETATGDGIALALRAGAAAADLEFVQFHPTVLYTGPAVGRRPLVTEAVRGEGAVLLDRAGRRVMAGVHPLADLAPRDVVAAAISRRMAATATDCVYLDARALDGFACRFPTVYAACRAAGVDPVREPIPVTPAAHYACGGVVTDLDGRTGVPGLYAAGEVARTGLHGANRLASNSLLEGIVIGGRVARAVASREDAPARERGHGGRLSRPHRPAGRGAAVHERRGRDRAGCRGPGGRLRRGRRRRRARRARRPGRGRGRGVDAPRPGRAGRGGHPHREPGRARAHRLPVPRRRLAARQQRDTPRRHRSTDGRDTRPGRRGMTDTDLSPTTIGVPDADDLRRVVDTALAEDLRYGPDATTTATVAADAVAVADLTARSAGVLAGLPAALAVLDAVLGPDGYTVLAARADGDALAAGDVALSVRAPVRGLLTAERTALNLVCHLSGVATATRAWVDAVAGTGARIRDTRKTLPGLRLLEKYAVRCGGGVNHRLGLGDAVLIKDNHVAAAGSVGAALAAARLHAPDLPCEVEVDTLDQLDEALGLGAELILLDNFSVADTAEAVRRRGSGPTGLESSGGLRLEVARAYAETGVDYLSIGALTHSVMALDLGLDLR